MGTPVVILIVVLFVVAVVTVVVGVVARRRIRRGTAAPPMSGPAPEIRVPRAEGLGDRVRALFSGGATVNAWAGLEDLLVRADVGPEGAADLVERVRSKISGGEDPARALREEIEAVLGGGKALNLNEGGLSIVMVVGVNGSGKTTTIGKLARMLGDSGRTVVLAGSDTFRAAACEQLDIWAERSGAHLVKQERGADPGSVAFDGVKAAQARGSDVLIVDTAGRLHTRTPLMDELAKVKRVLEKASGRAPDEVLLVLDATTGQNGISQARAFTEAVGVTGVALAKLDGTAKGGIVLAVREELGVPVKLVGVGAGIGDLEPFDAKAFAERLVGR